jgi:nucleotide-binding universal stress UspA family protein
MKAATTKTAAKRRRNWRSGKQLLFAHLLVPVDFSECSQQALRYADQIAASFGSKVSVVNVIPLNEGLLRLGAEQLRVFDEELRENQRRKLMAFVRTSVARKPFHSIVRLGQPVEEIIRTADDIGAAAIVISTHGLTGIKRALIGSTAEQVIRHAERPVCVVPARKMYD